MRSLAKTEVVRSAAIAALGSALVCYPRLTLWSNRSFPIWYVEALLVLGGFVLWAFVFAWHTQYTNRPVFTFKLGKLPFALVTLAGILVALALHLFVDSAVRVRMPEDYPTNLEQWIAMTLFYIGFTQLLLVFAPYDWSIRLFRRRWIAITLTVMLGLLIVVTKMRSAPTQESPSLVVILAVIRAVTALLSLWFYSRYGSILVWWFGFLLQTRHLLDMVSGS